MDYKKEGEEGTGEREGGKEEGSEEGRATVGGWARDLGVDRVVVRADVESPEGGEELEVGTVALAWMGTLGPRAAKEE